MIFAKNSKEHIKVLKNNITEEIVKNILEKPNQYANVEHCYFSFPKVEIIKEKDAYEYYRHTLINRSFSYAKKQDSTLTHNYLPPKNVLIDIYVIPKVYDYFLFLDCDDKTQYDECTMQLQQDEIPYISYRSSPKKESFWIFCDRFGTVDDILSLMNMYPADPKYHWVAKHKREFCIRAIPKFGTNPEKHESFGTQFSKQFSFWISEFDDYWENSKLITFIKTRNVLENI